MQLWLACLVEAVLLAASASLFADAVGVGNQLQAVL
jgi:hypothetical protein